MTKEEFIHALNVIETMCNNVDEDTGSYIDLSLSLMEECLNIPDDNDILYWWIYATDFGKDKEYLDTCESEIKTVDQLYDSIVDVYKK